MSQEMSPAVYDALREASSMRQEHQIHTDEFEDAKAHREISEDIYSGLRRVGQKAVESSGLPNPEHDVAHTLNQSGHPADRLLGEAITKAGEEDRLSGQKLHTARDAVDAQMFRAQNRVRADLDNMRQAAVETARAEGVEIHPKTR